MKKNNVLLLDFRKYIRPRAENFFKSNSKNIINRNKLKFRYCSTYQLMNQELEKKPDLIIINDNASLSEIEAMYRFKVENSIKMMSPESKVILMTENPEERKHKYEILPIIYTYRKNDNTMQQMLHGVNNYIDDHKKAKMTRNFQILLFMITMATLSILI